MRARAWCRNGNGKKNDKNPHAIELGRLGASKGGRALAARRTPEERSEAARKAAKARWDRVRAAGE